MAPKKPDETKEKKVLIAFRLDDAQALSLDEAVAAKGIPAGLNLSRSELARWALLDWIDAALAKKRKG